MPLSQEPIRQVRQGASGEHADWTYERLAAVRQAATQVRDSGFLWMHERTHLGEIIERISATVQLKHERDAYWRAKKKRGA